MEDDYIPLEILEICLHREEYFPGEIVTGKLLIVTKEAVTPEGIYIKFEGKATAKWKKKPAYLCGLQEAEFVDGEKSYFVNVFRYGSEQLPFGSSAFPFEFELPSEIPPTLRGLKHIKIRYSVDALIQTETEDYRQHKTFTVKGLLNLNAFPELSLPLCKTVRESLYESCWGFGQLVTLSFSMRKQGFVPGEEVKAYLLVKNCEDISLVSGFEIQLIQEMELRARGNTRIRRRIVGKNDILHVSSLDCATHKYTFIMKIPEDILISYETIIQDFISVRYCIRLSMIKSSFPYKSFQIHLPIKIGTVWIKEQVQLPLMVLSAVPFLRKKKEDDEHHVVDEIIHLQPTSSEAYHQAHGIPGILINEVVEDTQEEDPDKEQLPNWTPSPKRSHYTSVSSLFANMNRGTTNTVGDSCGSLVKPQEAFGGGDDDSHRPRSVSINEEIYK
ncbi:Arrestin domain-containing protein 4 [Orchesella cincta]|uniref:Arrestin domain-containing protein 4 n=1 Tax=Orchesella cincta TaxID=48709 RepID=A0A1D2MJE6_ORCCI|nr:Arrestin domain-containing protein 4 [Orchesella cincta]